MRREVYCSTRKEANRLLAGAVVIRRTMGGFTGWYRGGENSVHESDHSSDDINCTQQTCPHGFNVGYGFERSQFCSDDRCSNYMNCKKLRGKLRI